MKLDNVEVPDEFVDPITQTMLMMDPVHSGCGHIFQRSSLMGWVVESGAATRTCPLCRAPVNMLTASTDLKKDVVEWLKKNNLHKYLFQKDGVELQE